MTPFPLAKRPDAFRDGPSAPLGPRLRSRRRKARRRLNILLGVFAFVLLGTGIWGLWQPSVRITRISVFGTHSADLEPLVRSALAGTYAAIVPRDSVFFVPRSAIRSKLLSTYPDIGAVSISRLGFKELSVGASSRVNDYLWCGRPGVMASSTEPQAPDPSLPCYKTDPEGFIFAEAETVASSTSVAMDTPLQAVRVYGEIDSPNPIRAHVANRSAILTVLQFARSLGTIGVEIKTLAIRGDEVDFYLTSGTRLTYVLGQENAAAALAAVALPTLNLSDGSIDYVDLRFDGKVYLKKKEAPK